MSRCGFLIERKEGDPWVVCVEFIIGLQRESRYYFTKTVADEFVEMVEGGMPRETRVEIILPAGTKDLVVYFRGWLTGGIMCAIPHKLKGRHIFEGKKKFFNLALI